MALLRDHVFENRWEDRIESAVQRLESGFAQMGKENAEQHGALESRLARMEERIEFALNEANKKLESKNKAVRILCLVIVFLAGSIIGVKGNAIGLLKDIGF